MNRGCVRSFAGCADADKFSEIGSIAFTGLSANDSDERAVVV